MRLVATVFVRIDQPAAEIVPCHSRWTTGRVCQPNEPRVHLLTLRLWSLLAQTCVGCGPPQVEAACTHCRAEAPWVVRVRVPGGGAPRVFAAAIRRSFRFGLRVRVLRTLTRDGNVRGTGAFSSRLYELLSVPLDTHNGLSCDPGTYRRG